LPRHRYRRQINSQNKDGLLHGGRAISGSIPGTYYYGEYTFYKLIIFIYIYIYIGVGADPNYGSFIQFPNRPQGSGFLSISYDPDSSLNSYLINPDHQGSQSFLNSNNNAWQRPYTNNNNYNGFNNRYPPGSQGWYATGGNYWYNKGQSLIAHPFLLIITILILIIGM
jgi:hypothetical protein